MSDEPDEVGTLLEQLRQTVEQARALPMSASCVVHRGEVLELLDAVRQALPDQLDRATALVEHADAVLAQARRDGELELARARERAEQLVEEQAVVAAARSKAAKVVQDAQDEAARLLREADDYCDRRLADFEIDLDRIGAQVRRGRDKLRERAESDGDQVDGARLDQAEPT